MFYRDGFAVNTCSSCAELTVTYGDHRPAGLRHCRDCVQGTVSWELLFQPQRTQLLARFDRLLARVPTVRLREITPELDAIPPASRQRLTEDQ